jgi:hypothetical protein
MQAGPTITATTLGMAFIRFTHAYMVDYYLPFGIKSHLGQDTVIKSHDFDFYFFINIFIRKLYRYF